MRMTWTLETSSCSPPSNRYTEEKCLMWKRIKEWFMNKWDKPCKHGIKKNEVEYTDDDFIRDFTM